MKKSEACRVKFVQRGLSHLVATLFRLEHKKEKRDSTNLHSWQSDHSVQRKKDDLFYFFLVDEGSSGHSGRGLASLGQGSLKKDQL